MNAQVDLRELEKTQQFGLGQDLRSELKDLLGEDGVRPLHSALRGLEGNTSGSMRRNVLLQGRSARQ